MDLTNKVALVTGAARGIGRAIATALADAGCDVVVSDIAKPQDDLVTYLLGSDEELAVTANMISERGRRALAEPADVTSMEQLGRLVGLVEEHMGRLDVVVSNAGIIEAGLVESMDERVWDRIFAVNVKGVYLTAQATIPLLKQSGNGRIVNVASIAGKTGRGGLAAYCASKAAVISLTQALAEEVGPHGISVNALCPGFVKTDMFTKVLNPLLAGMYGVPEAEVFDHFVGQGTFLGREQTPEEIAHGAVYLCQAENVTGTTLTVAGGAEVH